MIAAETDRGRLIDRYRRNRRRSDALFATIAESAYLSRPIALRHPPIFYEGHLPAFSFLTLNERALGEAPIDAGLERLFERGIDPASSGEAQRHAREDWPSRERIRAFATRCDAAVERALATARLDDPSVPRLQRAQSAYTVLEHEPMHHETLTYILHQIPEDQKGFVAQQHRDSAPPPAEMRSIPAGIATLGADRDAMAFGWDNEFERNEIAVPAFEIDAYPVTNADYLRFVADGGPAPPFWIERDGQWYVHGVFEQLPLPKSWPVYASHRQAEAYAAWRGARLPSEAEYHRAAFGSPAGERAFPWGGEAPQHRHGNFDFQRYDPEPVDAHPDGVSAWGVHDLIGNGWEWTATPFAPFPGFEPMASYPQYSADFFDGRHFVMKGASPVTDGALVRRSFRNWFYDDYPYMYATFRCVA